MKIYNKISSRYCIAYVSTSVA